MISKKGDNMKNEKLIALRITAGLTQQQFGETLGYSAKSAGKTISAIESGARKLPANKAIKLENLFNVKAADLL